MLESSVSFAYVVAH